MFIEDIEKNLVNTDYIKHIKKFEVSEEFVIAAYLDNEKEVFLCKTDKKEIFNLEWQALCLKLPK
ncbi:hypothetical protein [Anaerovorax odorimutans]|uniref:hypothetical protein n=1 Tax=Anaerovorax odorimutans TaxID=109327 RepID=UPI000401BCF8|nr:hypothetical protein [Anaerovorax odorimutans]